MTEVSEQGPAASEPPAAAPAEAKGSGPSMGTALLIMGSVLFGMVGLVALGVVIGTEDDDTTSAGAATSTMVGLSEFSIEPAAVTVGEGATLNVMNHGTVEHNLAVEGEDIRTPNIAGGGAADLSVGELAAGEYAILCEIPGHADAGMTGTLTVTAGAGAAAGPGAGDASGSGDTEHDEMDYQAMTDAMVASISAFPAETAGDGNLPLEPTEVLADGTKVFDLTMELGDWEVAPGDVVEAWTFNGMVPGPRIDLEIGDRVQIRVQNDLPIATDVHLHGLNVENPFDGVGPIAGPLIEPGDSYTYEYVADEQAVAMYHPHAHGHMLLPDGMFGTIFVGDVLLPRGQTVGLEQVPADLVVSQELPMVLNDAGVIGYSLNGKSFPATDPLVTSVGDWVLIHYYNEGTQIHPMHLHQFDQIVVAKDGYPLDAPYTVDTLNVAPGERYSVLVNTDRAGTWVWHCHILPHVENESDGMFGMVTAVVVQ